MRIQGTVQDGVGDASFWLDKFSEVYRSWTGLPIYPGSLNLAVAEKFDWCDPRFESDKRIHSLIPHGGNRDICLLPCRISANGLAQINGFVWATTNAAQAPDYRVIEIIASTRLRDVLQLQNGSTVTIEVPMEWSAREHSTKSVPPK